MLIEDRGMLGVYRVLYKHHTCTDATIELKYC